MIYIRVCDPHKNYICTHQNTTYYCCYQIVSTTSEPYNYIEILSVFGSRRINIVQVGFQNENKTRAGGLAAPSCMEIDHVLLPYCTCQYGYGKACQLGLENNIKWVCVLCVHIGYQNERPRCPIKYWNGCNGTIELPAGTRRSHGFSLRARSIIYFELLWYCTCETIGCGTMVIAYINSAWLLTMHSALPHQGLQHRSGGRGMQLSCA